MRDIGLLFSVQLLFLVTSVSGTATLAGWLTVPEAPGQFSQHFFVLKFAVHKWFHSHFSSLSIILDEYVLLLD